MDGARIHAARTAQKSIGRLRTKPSKEKLVRDQVREQGSLIPKLPHRVRTQGMRLQQSLNLGLHTPPRLPTPSLHLARLVPDTYTLDSAPLPGSTFENASCIAPQSLIFDSTTTTFYKDSLPIPNSGYPSFGFPTYPCPPSAPLSTSTLGFDFDTAVTTSFDDPEYEEQLDVAGASIKSQDHIAALQMDRDLVQVSQVAGSTPNPGQGNDVHAASAHRGKRPREASPDVSVKAACKAPSQRPVKRTAGQKDDRTLTCPFVWVDHDRHQKCLKLKLRRIRDVKQHLHRTHEQPYYCRRCKAVFKDGADSAEAQEHDRSDTRCTNREHAAIPDGVTKSQFDSMKKSKADLVTQWHYIWDVLFPDAAETKPRSPFLTERLSYDITAFVVFSQTQGRRILQANPSLTARDIELVMSGMEVVLDAWASRPKDCLDT